jgi:hypothetical protein
MARQPMIARSWSASSLVVLAIGCEHPPHAGPVTSTGGGEPACEVGREGATSGAAMEIDATYAWTMVPGVAVEIDVDLGANGSMAAAFEAPGTPLDWDIHGHERGGVVVYASGRDIAEVVQLTAPAPGLFSFHWRNPGPADATLCVEVMLEGDASLHAAG